MNPAVNWYFDKADAWQPEIDKLRTIVLDCLLTEELKWGVPCYTFENSNVVLIHTFKAYCALLFFKGALLTDSDGLLVQQTKNVQVTRQIRFISLQQIAEQEALLKAYLYEAIEIEKAGLQVPLKATAEFAMPAEFQQRLDEDLALTTAFSALTPGRQRAYLLHFATPKQAKTRQARVDKHIPQILNGKGLNE